jgi:hypothetical protein
MRIAFFGLCAGFGSLPIYYMSTYFDSLVLRYLSIAVMIAGIGTVWWASLAVKD